MFGKVQEFSKGSLLEIHHHAFSYALKRGASSV
jgi:hypothetical protein